MKMKNLAFESGFRVVLGNESSQAAEWFFRPVMRKAARKIVIMALINGCTYCREPVLRQ